MQYVGRPGIGHRKRRVMMHLSLAPETAEFIEARAAERGMAVSRLAEELLMAGMNGGVREGKRVGFSEVETERT